MKAKDKAEQLIYYSIKVHGVKDAKEEVLKHSRSECLFWMKQMKCWIKDSKIKFMIFTDIYLQRHNQLLYQQPYLQKY